MTGVRFKDREAEEDDVTYGPSVVGLGMLVSAIAVTVWPVSALAGVALIALGIGMWVRESVRQNRHLTPPEVRRGFSDPVGVHRPSVYWWGAFGFGVVQLVAFGAALRIASAHGLLDPTLPDVPVTTWLGHIVTLVALASAFFGAWSVRVATRRPEFLTLPLVLMLAGALLHLALLALQGLHFQRGAFFPADVGAASAAAWVFAVHQAATLAAVLAMALLLVRVWLGPVTGGRFGATGAVVLFWWSNLVAWLVLYVTFYLRWVRIEAHLI